MAMGEEDGVGAKQWQLTTLRVKTRLNTYKKRNTRSSELVRLNTYKRRRGVKNLS